MKHLFLILIGLFVFSCSTPNDPVETETEEIYTYDIEYRLYDVTNSSYPALLHCVIYYDPSIKQLFLWESEISSYSKLYIDYTLLSEFNLPFAYNFTAQSGDSLILSAIQETAPLDSTYIAGEIYVDGELFRKDSTTKAFQPFLLFHILD